MVLAIGEGEGCTAAEADIRVNPLGRSLRVDHDRIGDGEVLWWEFITYAR